MGLVGNICSNKFDTLCGGRHNIYAITIHRLFNRLKDAGAELVFFTDGPVRLEKYHRWIEGVNKRYQNSIKIIDDVDCRMEFTLLVNNELSRVTSVYELLEDIARQHGSLTMALYAECDTEIAEYASKHLAVLAVLAEDSDFLIFHGNWRYFSLRSLNQNSLMIKEYNRDALRHTLNLNYKELACLSAIVGNDFITNANNYTQTYQKFINIAECIKRNDLTSLHNADLFARIAKILNTVPTESKLMQIEKSLALYDTNFKITDLSIEKPFIHKCLQHNMRFVYNVLSGFPVNFTLHYYDLRKESISFYELVIPLFKRKIGILYNHRCQSVVNCFVYSKLLHIQSYQLLEVSPIFSEQYVPQLKELLFGEDNDALTDVRFDLLKEIIGISSSLDIDLKLIPKNYLIDALVLVFLVLNKVINVEEADIILFSIYKVESGEFEEKIKYPSVLEPRAFRIAMLFVKMYSNFNGAVEVVGLLNMKVNILC